MQPEDELTAVRASVRTGRPLGEPGWTEKIAALLKLDLSPRSRGRPRKLN